MNWSDIGMVDIEKEIVTGRQMKSLQHICHRQRRGILMVKLY